MFLLSVQRLRAVCAGAAMLLTALGAGSAAASDWQHVGFAGCSARTVVFHPSSADTCYAGTDSCGAGSEGFHRSADGGFEWMDLGDPGLQPKCIAVHPENTQRMYITCPKAVYRTDDGGQTWHLTMDGITLNPSSDFMMAVAVNPVFAETVFVAKRSASYYGSCVYRSFDHAESWHELYIPYLPLSMKPYNIAIDPKKTSTLFVAANSYVLRSLGDGDVGSWHTVLETASASFRAVVVDPLNPKNVYAAALGDPSNGGVYRSTDGGDSWKRLGSDVGLESGQIITVAVDPVHPSHVYAGTLSDSVAVYRSTDGGDSWSPMGTGLPEVCRISALAVDPETGSVLLAATGQDGLYRCDLTTGVSGTPGGSAFAVRLDVNPNPLSPRTTVGFTLSTESLARVDVYNCLGQRVANLVDGVFPVGEHTVAWDGRDRNGRRLASGVYLIRLSAEGRTETRRAVLLR